VRAVNPGVPQLVGRVPVKPLEGSTRLTTLLLGEVALKAQDTPVQGVG
jgi:hypothetical protein